MHSQDRKQKLVIRASDVAAAIGVSISTVGRAMSDDPRISDETKTRVKRAAEKLGYVADAPARMMRGGSSNLVGLMIPDVANDFYAAIAQAMSECLSRHGYRLVLGLTQDDRDVELRHIRELVGARAAGIILVPTSNPRRDCRSLLSNTVHLQFLRHVPRLGGSWFGIDDEGAIRAATAHLISLGHRRIAYIGGSDALSTGASRVAGYRDALRIAGIARIAELEHLGPPQALFGEKSCRDLLALPSAPTALLMGSVHVTEGMITAIEALNVDIPRRLSVIGFGSSRWFEWWRGGLSAIAPPSYELATNCALWLASQLSNDARGTSAHEAICSSTLVLRGSTGPLDG